MSQKGRKIVAISIIGILVITSAMSMMMAAVSFY